MPETIVHLVGVERLALAPAGLPAPVAKALVEDLEYARLGAAWLDLPWYRSVAGELARITLGYAAPTPPALELLHTEPIRVGLRLGETVARGALVGTEAGLALVAGYFLHLSLDRSLAGPMARLLGEADAGDRGALHARRGVEWVQSLLWLRETLGYDPLGTPEISRRYQVVKRKGFPARGLGRGIYLLLRTAYLDVVGEAPRKSEVDSWVRGLWLHGRILGSAFGRSLSLPETVPEATWASYRSDGLDVAEAIEEGIDQARVSISRLYELMQGEPSLVGSDRFFLDALSPRGENERAGEETAPVEASARPS